MSNKTLKNRASTSAIATFRRNISNGFELSTEGKYVFITVNDKGILALTRNNQIDQNQLELQTKNESS